MPSRIYCRGLSVPMAGVGDLWYSCLRLNSHLGGVAIVVMFDWPNGFIFWDFCKGF